MDLRYHPERQSLASNCVWRRRSIFPVEWLQFLTASQCVNIISYVSLAVWNIPLGWKWTCYIISGAGYGLSGLLMAYVSPACSNKIACANLHSSWAHEICSDDNEERSLVIGSMNELAYVFQAWLPLIVWQQVDAPEYQKGFITVTVLSILLIIFTFLVRFLHKKEKLNRRYVIDAKFSI